MHVAKLATSRVSKPSFINFEVSTSATVTAQLSTHTRRFGVTELCERGAFYPSMMRALLFVGIGLATVNARALARVDLGGPRILFE